MRIRCILDELGGEAEEAECQAKALAALPEKDVQDFGVDSPVGSFGRLPMRYHRKMRRPRPLSSRFRIRAAEPPVSEVLHAATRV